MKNNVHKIAVITEHVLLEFVLVTQDISIMIALLVNISEKLILF